MAVPMAHAEDPVPGTPVLHEVQWAYADPFRVEQFLIVVSPVEGGTEGQDRTYEVGKPVTGELAGLTVFSATITGSSDEFVAIRAVGVGGQEGPLSSWRGLRPTAPGQPVLVSP